MANILYPNFDLQALFPEPVLSAEHFDPGYSGHSTDVWKVTTARRVSAVRVSCFEEWGSSPFWDGLRWLFGWRAVTARRTQARHRFLREAGGLPVPRVTGHGRAGEIGYLIMEWIIGPGGNILTYWWLFLPATLAILLFGIGWNLIGDFLNDLLNPPRR